MAISSDPDQTALQEQFDQSMDWLLTQICLIILFLEDVLVSYGLIILIRCKDTCPCFAAIFTKVNNFFNFLFCFIVLRKPF